MIEQTSRPATLEDLKTLLRSLNANGVDYLLIGGYALADIAYSHGFGNISHFNRQFKAHFGCSPKAFRDGP